MAKRTEAEKFLSEPNNFRDTAHLMKCLNERELDVEQDWKNGTTEWTFFDGSAIRIQGDDIEVIDARETKMEPAETVEQLMQEHAPETLEAMADHLEDMFDMDTLDMPAGLRNLLECTAFNLRTIITLAAAYEVSR